jgi:tetrapyrrole methylase family protein/MazG family protein
MDKMDKFLKVMDTLLGENGCPWDREQTHESLRKYMIEECYEAVDAINNGDTKAMCEELGDVLLQVVFHAKLAEKAGTFTFDDLVETVSNKIVSRHTHVFGEDTASSGAEVLEIWEANKAKESPKSPKDAMNAVPKSLPALIRAAKVIKRSKREMPSAESVTADIIAKLQNPVMLNEEFGKILLSFVTLSNILDINAEFSLTNALETFINTGSD